MNHYCRRVLQLASARSRNLLAALCSAFLAGLPACGPHSQEGSSTGGDERGLFNVGETFRDCPQCPEMVVVPSGRFVRGLLPWHEDRDAEADERFGHSVTVLSFAAGVYEVTFAEWGACVSSGGCGGYRPNDEGWGRGRSPVINVSWNDAQMYVDWLSRRTGERYRLLSEAEWEYVARAGTGTVRYWGDEKVDQCSYANGADASFIRQYGNRWAVASCDDGHVHTSPVGSYKANALGLHDVLGNVWEWTQDCWNYNYESYGGDAPDDGSAWEEGSCSDRVLRGGSWSSGPRHLRSTNRDWNALSDRLDNNGFRVARTLTP